MKTKPDTVLQHLQALADMVHDSEEIEMNRKEARLYMSQESYEELTEEVGHELDMVGGIRIMVTEEELDHG